MKNFSILAICAMMTACGGGGGGTQSGALQAPTAEAAFSPPTPTSTTASNAPAKVTDPCSVNFYGDSISAMTAPKLDPRFRLVTHAVVGGTAQAALPTFLQDPLPEAVIVIQYGTNDSNGHVPMEAALRSMLERSRSLHKKVILTGMPRTTAGDALYHATYDALIRSLGGEYGAEYANWPGVENLGLQPDGVHPGEAYAKALADKLSATIDNVLQECPK